MTLLEELKYIAESPATEHGGFHPRVVAAAKGAIERLAGQSDWIAALRKLRNEVSGMLGIAEAEIREIVGNTNVNCLKRRLEEADKLLDVPAESKRTSERSW